MKYLKREWNRKEGRGNKDSKKVGNLGQGVAALKRAGGLEPLYEVWTCRYLTIFWLKARGKFEPPKKFSKRGGLYRNSVLRRGLLGKRG